MWMMDVVNIVNTLDRYRRISAAARNNQMIRYLTIFWWKASATRTIFFRSPG